MMGRVRQGAMVDDNIVWSPMSEETCGPRCSPFSKWPPGKKVRHARIIPT